MKNIVLIPCSGAEYNVELARQVAIRLCESEPFAQNCSLLCFTILLRNHLMNEERLFELTKQRLDSSYTVVIDGCSGVCAYKLLKVLKIKPNLVVNLQKLIPKPTIDFNDIQAFKNRPKMSNIKQEDIEMVINYIIGQLEKQGFIKADAIPKEKS